jgi:serine/threonine protein kinase
MPPTPDPFGLSGRVLDGLIRVDHVAAFGGFSVVYRGFHLGLRETFAVKCLRMPPGLDRDTERLVLERFAMEGRLLYKLAHRGITRMFGVGATRASTNQRLVPFTVLEWLDGQTLAEHVRDRARAGATPMLLPEVVALLDGAVDGLAYAHTLGVAHRDVKPRNIFVLAQPPSAAYRTKLMDFGIAKVLDDRVLRVGDVPVSVGSPMLSPPYAAPEQFERAIGDTGPWTDVYALAIATLEAATGRRVLQTHHPGEYAARALGPVERLAPSALGLRWPQAVEQVFLKALSVEPRERWADAGVFWGALKHAMRANDRTTMRITPPPPSSSDGPADSFLSPHDSPTAVCPVLDAHPTMD